MYACIVWSNLGRGLKFAFPKNWGVLAWTKHGANMIAFLPVL